MVARFVEIEMEHGSTVAAGLASGETDDRTDTLTLAPLPLAPCSLGGRSCASPRPRPLQDPLHLTVIVGAGPPGEPLDSAVGQARCAMQRAHGGADESRDGVVALCVVDGAHERILRVAGVSRQDVERAVNDT